MKNDWLESLNRDDLIERLSQDLAETTDRAKHECESIILKAIDDAYEHGFNDGCEIGAEVDA